MKQYSKYFFLLIILGFPVLSFAQDWPKSVALSNGGKIIIYQPQPEKLSGNKLESRAAVSIRNTKDAEPVFGAIWCEAVLLTDKDSRMATLESIKVTDAKFPGVTDTAKLTKLKALLEKEIPKWKLDISLDEIISTLESEGKITSENLKNTPPKIIYKEEPSMLIIIDGDPVIKKDEKYKMERVMNTPFLILKNKNQYYLYGGSFWYTSGSVTGGWSELKTLPAELKAIDAQLKEQEKGKQKDQASQQAETSTTPVAIIVSTTPAELIQSKGKAEFKPVENTGLLYISNSTDDIFMLISSQEYYLLLTGRWYKATSLMGAWTYVPSDQLPEDFSKIPEGSEKDEVLVSVAGTTAAKEAVLDAQIPQTAKVDRKTATCKVEYDGEPKFEKIDGTDLQLAINTSSTVIRSGSSYYCVENGVWFKSSSAKGPWSVSTDRPKDVDNIPPDNAAYNVKYVYVYDVTPTYVYMGYTPGYLGCYVYGPTVVYGTGYYYAPWYGAYYYPRPVTWGFGMHYNPWTGWSMSVGVHYGFVSIGMSFGGGWWGPPMYRPPYRPYYGPHYGPRPVVVNNINVNNINRTNNIYNNRNDVNTRDVNRTPSARPANNTKPGNLSGQTRQPVAGRESSVSNNKFADKNGNVYQRDQTGNWQQNNNGKWGDASPAQRQDMNRDYQNRQRSAERNTNFQQSHPSYNRPSNMSRPAGGGARGGRR